jgi:uncharacterized membrane protein
MISISETASEAPTNVRSESERRDRSQKQRRGKRVNVGDAERAVSLAAGVILAALGLKRRSVPGMLATGVGGVLAYRGITGHCMAYDALKIDTAKESGIHVEAAFLINRSREDLYQYWRNFSNLPRIMTYLERVDVLDDRHSHWVARVAPTSAGTLEWDAEITRDDLNSLIAWRTLPDSVVVHSGEVRFARAMGDRGTEVHVAIDYRPPAGHLGHWIATLFGRSPRFQMREDLRNFKRMMETGEIPTICGQTRGTCK